MRFLYIASDNSASDATVLNAKNQDAFVKKIIFGAPSNGDILHAYNKTTAYGHTSGMGSVDSSDIALAITQPTAAAGLPHFRELNLAGELNAGLQLNGGAIHTDGSQVTVIWDDK